MSGTFSTEGPEDRAWYVGPQEGDNHVGDDGYVDRPIGSTGKVRGVEKEAVYVDWGRDPETGIVDEGWEPRSYLMTGNEWLRRQGATGWDDPKAWV